MCLAYLPYKLRQVFRENRRSSDKEISTSKICTQLAELLCESLYEFSGANSRAQTSRSRFKLIFTLSLSLSFAPGCDSDHASPCASHQVSSIAHKRSRSNIDLHCSSHRAFHHILHCIKQPITDRPSLVARRPSYGTVRCMFNPAAHRLIVYCITSRITNAMSHMTHCNDTNTLWNQFYQCHTSVNAAGTAS